MNNAVLYENAMTNDAFTTRERKENNRINDMIDDAYDTRTK